MVKRFAGNRELPLLCFLLITSLILPSEIPSDLLSIYLNHRSLFIRCL